MLGNRGASTCLAGLVAALLWPAAVPAGELQPGDPIQNEELPTLDGGKAPLRSKKSLANVFVFVRPVLEFNVHAVTEGIDAIGEVTVRLQGENGSRYTFTSPQSEQVQHRTFGGYGADTDIIDASAKAYLAALNKLLRSAHREHAAELAA